MAMRGIDALLELLAGCGVRYLFGNPGTTELPLTDALAEDTRFQYVLGLQEAPVMAMADGYAMASGRLAVVNLHISCGLGNAMGMLYNAHREGTPLLVTAGQQDRRLRLEEPILEGDLVSVARPWTKFAAEAQRVEDLPVLVRRAVQAALTPPTGPVFLSLPVDVQLEPSSGMDMSPVRLPDVRVRPPREALEAAGRLLLSARNPAILAGSRIVSRDATGQLETLAERLGAPVFLESGATHGRLPLRSDHPLNGQGLPLWSPEVRERLDEFDVILVAGMDLLRQYVYHEPARAVPEHVRLIHLDEDPRQLGKNYDTEVALLADTRTGLQELCDWLERAADTTFQTAAEARFAERSERHAAAREKLRERIAAEPAGPPFTPLALMGAIAEVLPDDVAVIEEAVTTTNTTLERLGALKNTSGYFGQRGWTLGWGLGCAIGAQLAWPERPVLALLGEGAAMYGIAGLWTAARLKLPVVFLICNNAQYQILKIGATSMQLPAAQAGRFAGLDLIAPEIDFVGLARSLGVSAQRAESVEQLQEGLRSGWKADHPTLIEVAVTRDTPSRLNYG